MTTEERAGKRSLAGKYMTFKLAAEEYGVEILQVRELIGVMEITRVPRARSEIRGVINLRGKVIPVLDLRIKFGLPQIETTAQSVIIVVQLPPPAAVTMGILVDEVLEVRALEGDQIEPPPDLGDHDDDGVVLGVGKAEKRVIFLLDIHRVLDTQARDLLAHGSAAAAAE